MRSSAVWCVMVSCHTVPTFFLMDFLISTGVAYLTVFMCKVVIFCSFVTYRKRHVECNIITIVCRTFIFIAHPKMYSVVLIMRFPGNFKTTRFQDNRYMKVVRLSALRSGRLYPERNIPGPHFWLRLSRPPGPQCGRKDYVNEKYELHHRESNPRSSDLPQPTTLPCAGDK